MLVNCNADGQTFKFRPRPAWEFQFQFLFWTLGLSLTARAEAMARHASIGETCWCHKLLLSSSNSLFEVDSPPWVKRHEPNGLFRQQRSLSKLLQTRLPLKCTVTLINDYLRHCVAGKNNGGRAISMVAVLHTIRLCVDDRLHADSSVRRGPMLQLLRHARWHTSVKIWLRQLLLKQVCRSTFLSIYLSLLPARESMKRPLTPFFPLPWRPCLRNTRLSESRASINIKIVALDLRV